MKNAHSFHIPVMGIGFTIDSPLKVAQYGIDSVVSLVDDILIEKLRKIYSEKLEVPYKEISDKVDDFRAKRITSYLNFIQEQAEKKFNALKNVTTETTEALKDYLEMLPESSILRKEFTKLTTKDYSPSKLKDWAHENLTMGSIDVNIMTKIDKENFLNKEQLPVEYNDAHAALRGYAQSSLSSSLVLSAGLNSRLYSYISNFSDFYPDENGIIKKKIILKVSDYRSAFIQGKILAKKGLWVSEYRIESGLNCGGHAFATDGFLLGPVLKEFKEKRSELKSQIQEFVFSNIKAEGKTLPNTDLKLKITAQGGVGTEEEQTFLLEEYNIDSVGWGTPFLLVPEATTVDDDTLEKLTKAKEEDLYLSNTSPLGVPFNTLKGNTKDVQKKINIDKNRPGSSCPSKFIALNKEFKEAGLCTASREYQYLKINELETLEFSKEEKTKKYNQIIEKSCICVGLGTSALIVNNASTAKTGAGVSVCPGPNMAYYSKIMSLKNMTDHIYGRGNVIDRTDRPNMFIKELNLYFDYLENKLEEVKTSMDKKQKRYLVKFNKNLQEGIAYYTELFLTQKERFVDTKEILLETLEVKGKQLQCISLEIENL
ncbi:hypothetical protein BTO04_03860 [Polaribacter sp. SA4-10]|uniref:hypothetical protein n=1 Tax=Polaribacter sp. SA4-10 TaxID=754397 RepID=UPI000B3C87CC|nr:hypothetical protein [Polaribacter sp. SA4-10]ARV05888.1 hypothetical protein BTO04_03860 [Polaribacter sp. SA4-10]